MLLTMVFIAFPAWFTLYNVIKKKIEIKSRIPH